MNSAEYNKIRAELAAVFQDTIRIVQLGKYTSPSGKEIILPSPHEMMVNTVFYNKVPDDNHISIDGINTEISVEECDSIDAGEKLIKSGYNPIVLNMASRRNPGGGVLNGARAQEETLFRRTNLFCSLYQFTSYASLYDIPIRKEQYPMDKNFGGIYTPNATVLRASDGCYTLLEKPFNLSFVAVAAINRPELNFQNEMTKEARQGTLNKIKTILRIALLHSHDSIVLGAFGCGAFKNPPKEIAKLFHVAIEDDEFRNKFKKIVFAIIDNHNSFAVHNPDGNLKPFRDEFMK